MKTLRLWDRIMHYFSPHFIAWTWDLISAFEWRIDGGLKGKMNCPTRKSLKSEIHRLLLQEHLFPKCSLECAGRWVCVFQCISAFSPVLNLCPHCVYSASLPRGQGASFWIQEAAELSSVVWAQNKLAEMSDLTFSPSARQMLSSLLRKNDTLSLWELRRLK